MEQSCLQELQAFPGRDEGAFAQWFLGVGTGNLDLSNVEPFDSSRSTCRRVSAAEEPRSEAVGQASAQATLVLVLILLYEELGCVLHQTSIPDLS